MFAVFLDNLISQVTKN